MTLGIFSTLCAVLFVGAMLHPKTRRMLRTRSWLAVGATIAPAGGLLVAIRDRLFNWATNASTDASGRLIGAGIVWGLALILVIWWALEMDFDGLVNKMRKRKGGSNKHTTSAATPWLGLFVLPALAIIPYLSEIPGGLGSTVTAILAGS